MDLLRYGTVDYFVDQLKDEFLLYGKNKTSTQIISRYVNAVFNVTFGEYGLDHSPYEQLIRMENLHQAVQLIKRKIR